MTAPTGFLKNIPFGIISLFLFLFSMTLSVRKVFFVFSPDGSGSFNEYTDISLYLSDVFLAVFITCILLENKKYILSILSSKKMFHVEQWKSLFFLPIPFLLWATISSFWAKSYELGWYSSLRLWEGYVLMLALWLFLVPRGTILSSHIQCSTWNILKKVFLIVISLGVFQALIAIGQFVKQGSLRLTFLQETVFTVTDPGIAKIVFLDQVLIRPYGLFLHPNVLSGFLGVTLLFTLAYPLFFHRKMFHVEHSQSSIKIFDQNVPRGTGAYFLLWFQKKCSTWNILSPVSKYLIKMFHVEQSLLLYRGAMVIQLFGFLITFSKAAMLSFVIAALYVGIGLFHVEQSGFSLQNVPRGTILHFWLWIKEKCSTWNNLAFPFKMFHVEHRRSIFMSLVGIFSVFFLIFSLNWHFFFWQPIEERLFLQRELIPLIKEKIIFGVGAGQSVLVMQDFFPEKLLSWQFQPVHNGYFILLEELGIIGVGIFLWVALSYRKMFHVEQSGFSLQNVPRGTVSFTMLIRFLKGGILYLLVISLFDHYVWDIESTRLLFWFLFGLLAVSVTHLKLLTNSK